MNHTVISRTFFVLSLLCCFSACLAQPDPAKTNQNKTLSHQDSVLLKRYLTEADNSMLFSYKRQLYLDSALRLVPTNAFWWQQKSMPLYKTQKYELGAPFVDSAVKYNNRYIDYRAFLKCIYEKKYSAAIADFEAAKKLKGFSFVMDHSYDFFIGLCHLQLNQFSQADSFLQSSIRFSEGGTGRGHYLDYFYAGISKMEQENYTEAISFMDKSIGAYAHFPEAKFFKALCLEMLDKKSEALAMFKESYTDCSNGYTMNEDNSAYVDYPYALRKWKLDPIIKRLSE